ncbi:SDR family NAD(P)-dependent oxidoreductase [Pseudonocardia xinjiangensis]|uniref:SDR family NAD(P)-dependent oxidoreductase n=1 Tax=Pseudonocardia xinjiangensis TaxID=75289 RepID=UPI003D920768
MTGAGRGIGRAVAVELAGPGVTVALLARSPDELAETAAQVRARGGTPVEIPVDLAETEKIGAAVERARESAGTIDTLVNNAGVVWPLGPTAAVDPGEWATAITINLVAVTALTLAVLPGMLAQRRGRIVNVSSGAAARPDSMIGGNAYVTSKTALEAHTLNLAAELADSGVTVNVYRPGAVETPLQGWIRSRDPDQIGEGLHERFVRMHADGALITPEHTARCLVGHLADADTGQVWTVAPMPDSA